VETNNRNQKALMLTKESFKFQVGCPAQGRYSALREMQRLRLIVG
jgi:hypothetical protein